MTATDTSKPSRSGISAGLSEKGKILCVAGLTVLVLFALIRSGLAEKGDRALFDLLMNLRVRYGMARTNRQIIPIDLNDRTAVLLKNDLDTRQAFADALDVLYEANTRPVFDFLFLESRPGDGEFARALREQGETILAVIAVAETGNTLYRDLVEEEKDILRKHLWRVPGAEDYAIPRARTFFMPAPALAESAARLAHVNMQPDTDGVYRRVPLFYAWNDEGCVPSLPLAAAVAHLGIDRSQIHFAGGKLVLPSGPPGEAEQNAIRIPVDKNGCALIPYTIPWQGNSENPNDRFALEYIVNAKDDPAAPLNDFTQKVAFLAEVTSTGKDSGTTAFAGSFPLSAVHTAVLGSILNKTQDSFLYYNGLAFQVLASLVPLAAFFFIRRCKTDSRFTLFFLAVFLCYTLLVFLRWRFFMIIPWYTPTAAALFSAWLAAFLFRLSQKYRERLLLENTLSRYLPHSLAERIMSEGRTELAPRYKELSILFSDIAGFTKWSSDKSPEVVHDFLGNYLESMSEIIFAHGGTVDKFMGDGMLAFFGDPFDLPDHARRCVAAACAMQRKIRILAAKWKPLVDIDLKVRMGINTGKVVVGNLGTRSRVEYTVVGAAVNLAQRMEAGALPGGILVTGDTRSQLAGEFAFDGERLITVKGYTGQIQCYDLRVEDGEE
ncbi:MAG: adenylate/guanylate cyclase domain-containing protein [Treponema sp.]|jgi:adenylate cyclase|nr:adenylate/guanylate cyclase domain-containing protein [Treponema sp.]